jgi:hypothetical protein
MTFILMCPRLDTQPPEDTPRYCDFRPSELRYLNRAAFCVTYP